MLNGLAELRVHDGDMSPREKENAGGDDPIQTVRNLCRRTKTTDNLGMDSLEEVAPMDIRLCDGVNWKLACCVVFRTITRFP